MLFYTQFIYFEDLSDEGSNKLIIPRFSQVTTMWTWN